MALPDRNSMPKRRLGKKDVTPEYLNVACGHVCVHVLVLLVRPVPLFVVVVAPRRREPQNNG